MSDLATPGASAANAHRLDTFLASSAAVAVCPFFLMGKCLFGDKCRRHHPDDPQQKIALPCKFFAKGRCNKGRACVFQHVLEAPGDDSQAPRPIVSASSDPVPPATTPSDRPSAIGGSVANANARKVCTFHLVGVCRYGEGCWFAHGTKCDICKKNAIHPDSVEDALAHLRSCMDALEREQTLRIDCGVACMLCFERPVVKGRKFGLLENCQHEFCLKCIRTWRAADSVDLFERGSVRYCPICRTDSNVVIPSDTMVYDVNVKKDMLVEYKEKLGRIPCRYFDAGRGECQFEQNCLFYHC